MSAVYFLIPGLRLPSEVQSSLQSQTDFSELVALTTGAEPVIEQTLIHHPTLSGAAAYVWLWQVIAKSTGVPETAAFEWEADGGPSMSTQTWRLWSAHHGACDKGIVTRAPGTDLTADERHALHDEVVSCVRRFGFELQQWENRWYLTRKIDWPIIVRPWFAQNHQLLADDSVAGDAKAEFLAMREALMTILQKSSVNEERRAAGIDTVDSFWPDGGSRRHLLKPSVLRAVMSNDSFVWGWAQNAGLLNFRTTAVNDTWPECPPGDLLAVLDDLWEPYRAGHWQEWQKRIPRLITQLKNLTDQAKSRRCERLVIVACGADDTHTVCSSIGAARGLLGRFKKKPGVNITELLSDGGVAA